MSGIKLFAPWGEMQPDDSRAVLGFKSVFGERNSTMNLSVDSIVLKGEDRKGVVKWIDEEQGRFENILVNLQSDTFQKDYYLDLNGISIDGTSVITGIKPRKGDDHFFSQADNITFEAIEKLAISPNKLSENTVDVPYQVIKDTNAIETLFIAFTTYSLITEIARTVKAITDLAGQSADDLGTGLLTTIIQALALAIYLVAMILALIAYLKQIVAIFFPKVRYLKAMSDYILILLGCRYLGYELDSTLLQAVKNQHTLPIPISRQDNKKSFYDFIPNDLSNDVFNYGYPTANDTTPTLGEFIRSIEKQYNAQTYVYEGIVKIETRAFFVQNPLTSVPVVFNDQQKRVSKYGYDTSSDFKRKILSWSTDFSDMRTVDKFYKVSTEKSTEPVNFIHKDLVNIQGYKDFNLGFSLGARKNELNPVEKLVKGVLDIGDGVVGLFGGSSNFSALVTDRIGILIIGSEVFSITKKLWLGSDKKQPDNFINYLGADYLYNTYHKYLEVLVNSARVYQNMPFPCTEFKFSLFSRNKYVNLEGTDKIIELIEGQWVQEQSQAVISYKEYDNSGFNTKTQTIY